MSGNIYLTGFMGAGKSTVGRSLAATLRRAFVDMDEILEKRFKRPIADVFKELGEEAFREKESALLRELARRDRLVVATGGGVPTREDNLKILSASGVIVHLRAELRTLLNRLDKSEQATRPLWRNPQSLKSLYEERKSSYARNDHAFENNGRTPEEVVLEIVRTLYPDQKFTVLMGGNERPVIATWRAEEVLPELTGARRVAILTDRSVARLHLPRLVAGLNDPAVITIAAGERSKTLNGARKVIEKLLENHFERSDLLVAVGGGVVTDLGGFVAAVYKRGMRFLPVSTSLVGCVDAAIGGKTAVNVSAAKNMIGAFKAPEGVVLDMRALGTLKRGQVREGMVEAYKTGLVYEPALVDLAHGHIQSLLAQDGPLLGELASLSARAKARIVSQDFLDTGLRRILNFGHTYGHAVEAFNDFKISHGRGVASGMRVATLLSQRRGLISPRLSEQIQETLRVIDPLPTPLPPVEQAWGFMLHDKKMVGGKLIYVLLKGRGNAVCVDDVSKQELADVLSSLERIDG